MAVLGLIGLKKNQTQIFLENGIRIPVTQITIEANKVYSVKTQDKNDYTGVQLGIGTKKHANKALLGHSKKAASDAAPLYLREIRKIDGEDLPSVGDLIKASDIFKEGDIVDVSGLSKGKGFAGVVKRHGFHGGPKTHGQSDRHRAPGAIGQGTTPGRVYKGKRMAGRMGQDNTTIRNLLVVAVDGDEILVKGLVPGIKKGLLVIQKVGESKKFVPIYKEVVEEPVAETAEESKEVKSEAPVDAQASEEKPVPEASAAPVDNPEPPATQIEGDVDQGSPTDKKDEVLEATGETGSEVSANEQSKETEGEDNANS